MRSATNDEIKSEVYDEFLAIDLTEQQEFEEDNNNSDLKATKRRRLKDSVSTYLVSSGVICSALLSQVID